MAPLALGTGPTVPRTYTFPDADAVILTSANVVTAAQGGTGQTSYAVGDLLYASGSTALSKLADVAVGSVLVSGGVTTAPSYSANPVVTSISLGTNPATTGALRLANNQYISGRNAGNSADLEIARIDSSNALQIGGATTQFAGFSTSGSFVSLGAGNSPTPVYDWCVCNDKAFKPQLDNTYDLGDATHQMRNTFQAGYHEGSEMTAPSAPAANKGRLYFEDDGAGKTRLMVIFSSGAAQQVAIQP